MSIYITVILGVGIDQLPTLNNTSNAYIVLIHTRKPYLMVLTNLVVTMGLQR